MAEATKKTAAKKTAAKKGTKKKTTAGTTPSKTSTKKTTTRVTPSKKTTRTSSARTSAPRTQNLLEREPAELLETAGYAATSIVTDAITLARNPERLESSLAGLRSRLGGDLERSLETFTRVVDERAAEGRKVVDDVVQDERVSRVLDQTSNTRAQLRAALTSVTRTADVAGEAAGDQADVARSQIRGAGTVVRNSTGTARSSVKGAATSVLRIADAAYGAASKQAPNAKSQVKAAATAARRSVDVIRDAASETAADAEAETAD